MKIDLKKLTLTAMFLAVGLLLPFVFAQLKQLGKMLLPMHLPVFLCSLICGWQYGLIIGFIMPLMRSALFSMPVLFPGACAMAFELAAYGFFAGFVYSKTEKIYFSLVFSMLAGRAVWAAAQTFLLGISGKSFTLAAFWAGAFSEAFPGIILQLVLVPMIVKLSHKAISQKKP